MAYLAEPVPTVPQPRPSGGPAERPGPWLFTRPAAVRPSADRARGDGPTAGRPTGAVLFERDGTLIQDVSCNGDPAMVHPAAGIRAALALLRAAGLALGFAETEQVAFHTASIVPGIDFTNDPLLQGRNFSYLDTQLIRLGGPNFAQLPVNRPLAEVRNNHRDGYGQQVVHPGTGYAPNSVGGGCPAALGGGRLPDGVFEHYQERIDGAAIRRRSPSFADHYSQAALFWRSMADWEQQHIVEAFSFELGKVVDRTVRRRMVGNLAHVDRGLAAEVARRIGLPQPATPDGAREGPTGDAATGPEVSPALSLDNLRAAGIRTRKVAVLIAPGVDGEQVRGARERLAADGATVETLAAHGGHVPARDGESLTVDRPLPTTASVLYDAVIVPDGGEGGLVADPDAVRFLSEALRHGKPVALLGAAAELCGAARYGAAADLAGVAAPGPDDQAGPSFWEGFALLVEQHRFPQR
ncbi:catalase [Kitasatospora sp. NPDC085464]|uniref:catalase n=1 Tax=Kitasatospora sp. NPDC085464 TaxID=3364063 RepID=UPI0037C8C2FE